MNDDKLRCAKCGAQTKEEGLEFIMSGVLGWSAAIFAAVGVIAFLHH